MAASTYQIDLADGISGPATQAAAALKSLQARIDADRNALKTMEREMRKMQKASVVNIDNYRVLQKAIDRKKASIEQASTAFTKLASGQLSAAATAVNLRGRLKDVSSVAQAIPPALGGPIDRFSKLAQVMLGSVPPTVALRVGVIALVAVLGTAVGMLTRVAIGHADARRAEGLHLAQLARFRVGAAAVAGLQESMDRVSASVSIGRDEVGQYGAELARAGLRGAALEDALRGASITASALGKDAGAAFVRAAKGPGQTAASIRQLADAAKAKLGGVVQAQLLTLEVQSKKAKEGFATLFSGLKIDGYLKALKSVRDMFSATNSSAGRALKALTEAFGQPIINALAATLRGFKAFFVQALIGVYELLIAYELIRIAWVNTFGPSKTEGPFKAFFKLFQPGRVAVYLLAAAFTALGVSVLIAHWPIVAIAAGVYLLATLMQALAGWALYAGAALQRAFSKIGEFFGHIGAAVWEWNVGMYQAFANIGLRIWEGLKAGLSAGWDALKSTVLGYAESVSKAFQSVLGISSPSKVFEAFGGDITAGLTIGVERTAPQAEAAVGALVDVPSMPGGASPTSELGGGTAIQSGVHITIGALNITAPSADAPAIATSLRRELESMLESLALELGATPAGAQ